MVTQLGVKPMTLCKSNVLPLHNHVTRPTGY